MPSLLFKDNIDLFSNKRVNSKVTLENRVNLPTTHDIQVINSYKIKCQINETTYKCEKNTKPEN